MNRRPDRRQRRKDRADVNASLAREYPCGHRHASAELAQRCPKWEEGR